MMHGKWAQPQLSFFFPCPVSYLVVPAQADHPLLTQVLLPIIDELRDHLGLVYCIIHTLHEWVSNSIESHTYMHQLGVHFTVAKRNDMYEHRSRVAALLMGIAIWRRPKCMAPNMILHGERVCCC